MHPHNSLLIYEYFIVENLWAKRKPISFEIIHVFKFVLSETVSICRWNISLKKEINKITVLELYSWQPFYSFIISQISSELNHLSEVFPEQ